MTKNVLQAADEGLEVGAMYITERNASHSLECLWVLSGTGLACMWTECRRDARAREWTQDKAGAGNLRVA
jgi:hypothetical protein